MFSTLAIVDSFRNTTSSYFGGLIEIFFFSCNDTVMPSGKQHATAQIVQQRLDLRGRDGIWQCHGVMSEVEARSHNERLSKLQILS